MQSCLFISCAIGKNGHYIVPFGIYELTEQVQAVQLVEDVKADNILVFHARYFNCVIRQETCLVLWHVQPDAIY